MHLTVGHAGSEVSMVIANTDGELSPEAVRAIIFAVLAYLIISQKLPLPPYPCYCFLSS